MFKKIKTLVVNTFDKAITLSVVISGIVFVAVISAMTGIVLEGNTWLQYSVASIVAFAGLVLVISIAKATHLVKLGRVMNKEQTTKRKTHKFATKTIKNDNASKQANKTKSNLLK